MSIAGLILAAMVAIAAFLLSLWERMRIDTQQKSALNQLSIQLRAFGIRLLWVESLLLAIGAQLPIEQRSDRLLFLSIWSIIGTLAILLIILAMADAIVRLIAHRIRAKVLRQALEARRSDINSEPDENGVV